MEWKSEEIKDLADALAKAQGLFKGAKADSDNPFFKSKYADLESVWDAVKEPLSSNGLSIIQLPVDEAEGQRITIMTILLHSSGQWISSRITLPAVKNDPQAYGSAYTYARRYALQAMLCIPTVDDDGEGAMQRDRKAQQQPEQTKQYFLSSTPSLARVAEPKPQPTMPEEMPLLKPMSDQQRKLLWSLCGKAGLSRDDSKGFIVWANCVTSKAASALIENFDAKIEEFRNETAPEPGSMG